MKRSALVTPDFHICFDSDTLIRTKSGSITGVICWRFGDFCFPSPKWSDFVVVVSGWWIDALGKQEGEIVLHFMDGPYAITLTDAGNGEWRVECYEDRKEMLSLGKYHLPFKHIQAEAVEAGKSVLDACRKKNWNSKDLEVLENLLVTK